MSHAQQAEQHLEWSERQQSPELGSHFATVAQAHATLALAEQQRIANVIALASLSMSGKPDARHIANQALGVLVETSTYVSPISYAHVEDFTTNPEIKEALGL